ncbi:sterol desaturase family protein [Catenovulum sp. SM1970]|uniref:sterol desaturase family protein n=1 Tax=Marinifaba aquimaris TaxID=2741323 RepID=UPI0015748637|nr:sterol desaturase family protein [Marinifaba aquimaris]NTS78014.1 sterol desaturase family protein [Marinifaba aquimaris]
MFEAFTQIQGALVELAHYVLNPSKRIYWLYLLSGLGLALVWAFMTSQSLLSLLKKSCSAKYWFSKSSQLDLKWITVNQLLALFLLLPLLTGQVAWAMSVYRFLTAFFGSGDFIQISSLSLMLLFTITVFLFEDFSRFLVHYAYHKVPLLWRFHAIHHSALTMTPLTLYRVHFIEYCINACRSLVVTGTVSGVFIYCFVGRIGVYEVLGVSIFNLVFNLAGANLRHSHVWLGFGKFENWFISPAQHQIHHSSHAQHLDKNFGASLSIWDRLFGSWLGSKKQTVKRFGLYKTVNPQKFYKQIFGIKPL